MNKLLLLLILFTAFSGCATYKGPYYLNEKSPEKALIRGKVANFFKAVGEVEANVMIEEVDGLPIKGSRKIYLSEGTHEIGITLLMGYGRSSGYINVQVESSKEYLITAYKHGASFKISLVDETDKENPITVSEQRFQTPTGGGPVFVPIYN